MVINCPLINCSISSRNTSLDDKNRQVAIDKIRENPRSSCQEHLITYILHSHTVLLINTIVYLCHLGQNQMTELILLIDSHED